MTENTFNFQLKHPALMTIVGPTCSGKSTFTIELIRKRNEIFDKPIDKVIYVYTEHQNIFDELQSEDKDIVFTKNLEEVENILGQNSLIIFDDLMVTFSKNTEYIEDWFVRKAHHRSCSVVCILQNLNPKNMRNVTLNTIYLVYFKQPRDTSVLSLLDRQISTGHP